MLNDVIRHLREDVGRIEEPRVETTAEVSGGLVKAFDHYGSKAEEPGAKLVVTEVRYAEISFDNSRHRLTRR